MPTYVHQKYGIRLPLLEGMTDEQVGVQMDRLVKEHEAKAKEASTARTNARGQVGDPNAPLPAVMGKPPTTPPSDMDALEEFMGGPEAPAAMVKGTLQPAQAAPGSTIQGEGAPTPEEHPWSPLGALLGLETPGGIPRQSFRGALAETVGKAALPMSLAAGPAAPAAGRVVAGLAGKVLPKVVARGAGALATGATGAAMTGVPITVEGLLRGEDLRTAGTRGALYGAGGEVLGAAGAKVVGKVLGRSTKVISEAMKAQEALVPLGATLTAGQLSKSRMVRLFETAADYGILSGQRMGKVREASHDAAQTLLLAHMGDLPVRGGSVVANAYTDLGKKARGVTVDMLDPFMDAVNLRMRHQGRIPEVDKMADWVGDLAAKYPDGKVPFSAVADLRSDLLAVEKKTMGTLTPQKVHGAAEKLAGSVDRAMEAGIPSNRPDIYAAWRGTNALARKAIFRDSVEDMITLATKDGKINGTQLAHKLERMTKAQAAKFDPAELADLKEFTNVLKQAESRNPDGTLRMWVQLVQGGAAAGLIVTGTIDPEKALILGAPYMISLALTSPRTIRYLTQGLRGVGTPASLEAMQRVVSTIAGRKLAKGAEEPDGTTELARTLRMKP